MAGGVQEFTRLSGSDHDRAEAPPSLAASLTVHRASGPPLGLGPYTAHHQAPRR